MLKKTVTKLWQGKFCSVRDYEVSKAIKKEGMLLQYKDKQMYINKDKLKNLKPTGKIIQSNYKGTYQLVDILFVADKNNVNQSQLFEE
jgi:L-serine deaminase